MSTAAAQAGDPFAEISEADLLALIERTTDPYDLDALIEALETTFAVGAAESSPSAWCRRLFPSHVRAGFAEHHHALLDWAWSLEAGKPARSFLACWPRGGAKSTLAELVVAMVAARGTRRYGLYIGETQDLAEEHVANIAGLLEAETVARMYPGLKAAVSQFGHVKAWRRNRLQTSTGFVIDAIGLDTAARGVKVMDQRPNIMVIDDVDDQNDSPATVMKKLQRLGRTLLPAGAEDVVVLYIQNLIHLAGVMAKIIDGSAEILRDRIQSGPIPAIVGAYAIEETGIEERPWRIIGGEPSWPAGQSRERCERDLNREGPTNWESEYQHKPRQVIGSMFEDVLPKVAHCTRDEVPDLVRKSIAVDPAVTDTDASDSHGVQCDGIASNDVIYRLRSWEQRAAPRIALKTAITWAYEEGVLEVLVEMNTGSDLSGKSVEQSWRTLFRNVDDEVREEHPEWAKSMQRRRIKKVRATSSTGSKATRGSQMHADYERPGRIVHVIGDHDVLEAALGRAFVVKPFDLADAGWYSWRELRHRGRPGSSADISGTVRR